MIWGWLIPGWLKRAAAWLAIAALAIIGIRMDAKRDAKRDAKAKAAKDHIKTRKEIDDALASSKRSGAGWRDRLRQRDK